MRIVHISQDDDLATIARKCEENFQSILMEMSRARKASSSSGSSSSGSSHNDELLEPQVD